MYFPVSKFQSEPFEIAFHCDFVPKKLIFARLEQLENAYQPMLVTLSGIVILVRVEQSENARF